MGHLDGMTENRVASAAGPTARGNIAAGGGGPRGRRDPPPLGGPAGRGIDPGHGPGAIGRRTGADVAIPYAELPQFPRATALGHRGRLICGWLEGVPLVTLDGRCHLYEGYSLDPLMLPVYALRASGVERLIVSNAAGGLNPRFARGDVMIIEDHLSFCWAGGGGSRASGRAAHAARRTYDRR